MRLAFGSLVPACLLAASTLATHADTISAGAVGPITLTPSADTFSLSAASGSFSTPAFVMQTGTFHVGDSGSLVGDFPFSFSDVVTVNGITQTLNFTGAIDHVGQAVDYLTLQASGPYVFGNVVLNVLSYTSPSGGPNTDVPIALSANVTSVTPEPASLSLLGTGLLGGFALLRRRFHR